MADRAPSEQPRPNYSQCVFVECSNEYNPAVRHRECDGAVVCMDRLVAMCTCPCHRGEEVDL